MSTKSSSRSDPPRTLLYLQALKRLCPTTPSTTTKVNSPLVSLPQGEVVLPVSLKPACQSDTADAIVLFDNAKKQTTDVINALREESKSEGPVEKDTSKSLSSESG
jgi:hypothetical protein